MTRDELRAAIQETVDSMRGDSIMALAATNAIMALVDQYSVEVVQDAIGGVMPGYLPRPTEQEARAWLAGRK